MKPAILGVVAACATAALGKSVPETTATRDNKACRAGYDHFKFCDTSLSKQERVRAVIDALEDEEIPPLLTARAQDGGGGGSPGPSNAVPRLGLPQYDWGLNCIHGVQSSCVVSAADNKTVYCPTTFPNAVNLGASWNDSMWEAMGGVIGREARALYVAGATEFSTWSGRLHIGLDCWSPNINLNRDPRWGRNSEVPSEDPRVNGAYGAAVTRGQQRNPDEPRYLQSIATLKHWAVYQLEDSDGKNRGQFNAEVNNYTLATQYFPAFAAAVRDGGAKGVMCSYNEVNGVPSCANKMLDAALRDTWGFDGYVTSDTTALSFIYESGYHHYVNTSEEAACASLAARTDVASDTVYHNSLLSALGKGLCGRELVDAALTRTFGLLFDLGLFDPVDDQPLWRVPLGSVGAPASVAMSQLAARESLVLLKNDEGPRGLPFAKQQKVGIFGPHAKAQSALQGDYNGQICPEDDGFTCIQTPLDAVSAVASSTVYAKGCAVNSRDASGFAEVLDAIDDVDAAVLYFGIDTTIEKESHDRTRIGLPGVQADLLLQALRKLRDQSKPAVVVLINGGGLSLGQDIIDAAPAILEAFYPGRYGSAPIADTIFGDNDNLGGKMPYTVYPADYIEQINMSNMAFNDPATPGRSYRYYRGAAEWAFGHGLSLTTFAVEVVDDGAAAGGALACDDAAAVATIRVRVANTGARTGDTVVQVYKQPSVEVVPDASLPLAREIIAWRRVHLAPGASTTVAFTLTRAMFLEVTTRGDRVCHPEARRIVVTDGDPASATAMDVTLLGNRDVKVHTFPDV